MKTKNNQLIFVVTSAMCLLPVMLSLLLYNNLPDQIAVHWNSAGVADNFLPKAMAAFGLPILFVAINIYSKIRLFNDPKRANNDHSQGVQVISTWLVPILSLVLVPVTLFMALGVNVPITMITSAVLGVVFILIGNYLSKCRQNYTIGIKLPWTLNDPDNWNKTHHIAGHLWMIGGLIVLIAAFFSINQTVFGVSVLVLVVIFLVTTPIIYSYLLYKKMIAIKSEK